MPLKVELHTHTSDDPLDRIPYSTVQLIDHAAALGFNALAVTLHDRQLDIQHLAGYARERGVVLIPGVERTIGGKHVLLLNFPRAAESVNSFDEIRELKARYGGLVIAPHPFFPWPTCLGQRLMDAHADIFDAVEMNAFYMQYADFNRPAARWACTHGKPLVGNGDVHRLAQLGTTYSMVDAESDVDAICGAIRAGRVRVERQPMPLQRAVRVFSSMALSNVAGHFLPVREPEELPGPAHAGR